jgi:hypothetical protein
VSTYPGIDYSLGLANVDRDTGIHYGVIPANAIGQAWYDSAEADYGPPTCPKCGDEAPLDDALVCKIHGEVEPEDAYGEEPIAFRFEGDGIVAVQGGGDSDVFVLKSPVYIHAAYCSPCAPGAGYLLTPCEAGPKTYAFPADWFDEASEPCPYTPLPVDVDDTK